MPCTKPQIQSTGLPTTGLKANPEKHVAVAENNTSWGSCEWHPGEKKKRKEEGKKSCATKTNLATWALALRSLHICETLSELLWRSKQPEPRLRGLLVREPEDAQKRQGVKSQNLSKWSALIRLVDHSKAFLHGHETDIFDPLQGDM